MILPVVRGPFPVIWLLKYFAYPMAVAIKEIPLRVYALIVFCTPKQQCSDIVTGCLQLPVTDTYQ